MYVFPVLTLHTRTHTHTHTHTHTTARCILKNPQIVLQDEASSALDSHTEQKIHEALNKLGKDRTMVVIAHRLSTIKNADQIVVLEKVCVCVCMCMCVYVYIFV
jgi:ABC-type transport system involved in Fe-S cluster assembly fused permease/ATPase subunit